MAKSPWLRIGFDAWSLGIEASAVIGLRAMKMAAGGPSAEAEMRRMVTEKIESLAALQAQAMTGGLGASAPTAAARAISHYRRKVRGNRRRLTGG